jgi:hypothetical protein
VGDDRQTAELLGPFKPKPKTGYSMRRAVTQDERSQLVERVGTVTLASRRGPRWRVEQVNERVVLKGDGVQLDLSIDEARRLAEEILLKVR